MMSTETEDQRMEIVVTPVGVDLSRTDVSTEHDSTVTYEPLGGSYRASFDGESTSPSEAVVDVVAAVEATDPVDMPPLFHAVDPDALDSLVSSVGEDSLCISFAYDGHDVAVTA